MPNNRTLIALSARWGLLLVAFVLVLGGIADSATLNAAAPPAQGEDPPAVIELPPEALDASALQSVQARRQPGTKIESSLSDLVIKLQTSNSSVQDIRPGLRVRRAETRVHTQIAIDANAIETITEAIDQAGGEVTGANADTSVIQSWLPIGAIDEIAALSGVHAIRRPNEAFLLDTTVLGTGTTTEALDAINAPAWHAGGQIGAGVRVGVIDKGFMGYGTLLGTELPVTVKAKNFVDGENPINVDGTTQHGTACAEIIYDIAPGVSLYLAKVNTDIDLQEAVDWLKSENVDVITTSLTWYNVTPGDGTGEFADLVADARSSGILWTTAAGNDRENHWGGSYVDAAPGDPNNDRHTFGSGSVNCFGPSGGCYAIEAGETLRVFLRWDDWTEVVQDFDLYLVRWNGSVWQTVASSTDPQEGRPGQRPTEYAAALTSDSTTAYGFYIDRYDGTRDVNFEIFSPKTRGLSVRVSERSLGNLADAPDAITVAALDVDDPFPQEDYSAEGPTNGLGGTASGGFTKPDLAAYANVSVQGYGIRGFDGTSAATPHVAGAAALVLGLNPDYTPDEVQAFLEARAVDMGTLGRDTVFGYGRLYLGELSPAPIVTSITPNSGVYTGIVKITSLTGANFKTGTAIHLTRSNHNPITGTNVALMNATTLSLDLDLTGAANGSWDVVVTNPNGKSGTLKAGFTVLATATAPRVLSISPTLSSAEIVLVTVVGQGFVGNGSKPTVELTKAGQAPIVATDVTVVDSDVLTCQFDLSGVAGGKWNVVVTNPDGAHWTLSKAFTVIHLLHLPYVVNGYPPPPEPPDPLYPVEDTMVAQGDPAGNYDRETDMWVGYDADSCEAPPDPGSGKQVGRGLVKFDTRVISPGTPIPQATLFVYLAYHCDIPGYSRTVTLHRATSFWSGDTVDWTTQPSLGEAVGSLTLPPMDERAWGWYAFDVTDLVQGWVEGDYLNLGLGIRGPEGSGADGARLGFITSDYLDGAYAPRILFSNDARSSASASTAGAPALELGCLPEPLGPSLSQDSTAQLIGVGLCLAE